MRLTAIIEITDYHVSIHAPRVGCDPVPAPAPACPGSFNSRTPCGVRLFAVLFVSCSVAFQFTHPVWGATTEQQSNNKEMTFQFTHPVWGATTYAAGYEHSRAVSIHAPRVGCDSITHISLTSTLGFNSRTPCGVRPHVPLSLDNQGQSFNSRTPCGVRRAPLYLFRGGGSFNSRTPCGVRLLSI